MMSCCHDWNSCDCWNHSYCPFPQWKHPLLFNPAHFCSADSFSDNGPTLVIHQILLEPCGNQSCTPRTFTIRVTGPSYPCGETFTLRAGSCTELDEPLVIAGLIPGQYEIEQLNTSCSCGCGCSEYETTFTGPISCGQVSITASRVPTVITIVSRKRVNHRHRRGCSSGYNWQNGCGCNNGYGWQNGCGCNSGCNNGYGWQNGCGCNSGC